MNSFSTQQQSPSLESLFRQVGNNGGLVPATESYDRGKTIFFPGDPAERVYFLVRGAVKLSRVYESGEEITVALL
ncbi:MAG: cyclic nucleotide-binding domain-containing protein, partial [Cyanobacteria bacterium J06641_5]